MSCRALEGLRYFLLFLKVKKFRKIMFSHVTKSARKCTPRHLKKYSESTAKDMTLFNKARKATVLFVIALYKWDFDQRGQCAA